MGDPAEPPDSGRRGRRKLKLRYSSENPLYFCNPDCFQEQTKLSSSLTFVFRAIESRGNQKCSYIYRGTSQFPFEKIENPSLFIPPNNPYNLQKNDRVEGWGIEDPRIGRHEQRDRLVLACTEYDGINAIPGIYETDRGLSGWCFRGVMFPIPLERAIEIVSNPRYKELWKKDLEEKRRRAVELNYCGELLLTNKDVAIDFSDEIGKYVVLWRWFNNIQGAVFNSLEEIFDEYVGEEILRNIDEFEVMETSDGRWLGAGSLFPLDGQYLGTYHEGSRRIISKGKEEIIYSCGYFLGFPEKGKFKVKKIKPRVLQPKETDVLKERERIKKIIFAVGLSLHPPKLSECNSPGEKCYSCEKDCYLATHVGLGDNSLGVVIDNFPNLLRELNNNPN